MSWQTEHLRLTVFTSVQLERSAIDGLWSTLANAEPDQVVDQPKLQTSVRVANVQLEGRDISFQLASSPLRLDITWSPGMSTELRFPVIAADMNSAFPALETAASQLFSQVGDVVRVAVGGAFVLNAVTRENAYEGLAQRLPIEGLSAATCSDLLYQINRPSHSTVIPQLQINRLSKWSAVKLSMVSIPGATVGTAPDLNAIRVEVDINTSPENQQSLTAQGTALVSELIAQAIQRVEQGDRQ